MTPNAVPLNPPANYQPGDKYLSVQHLTITPGAGSAYVDVNDGAFFIAHEGTGAQSVFQMAQNGLNTFGSPGQTGILSSLALNDPNGNTGVNYLHNDGIYDYMDTVTRQFFAASDLGLHPNNVL